MQWWAIIKMIAGIISNLPFDASEEEVRSVVGSAVCDAQSQQFAQDASIPQTEWEELIGLLVPVIMWLIRRFGKAE
jgi:hypothetical protein